MRRTQTRAAALFALACGLTGSLGCSEGEPPPTWRAPLWSAGHGSDAQAPDAKDAWIVTQGDAALAGCSLDAEHGLKSCTMLESLQAAMDTRQPTAQTFRALVTQRRWTRRALAAMVWGALSQEDQAATQLELMDAALREEVPSLRSRMVVASAGVRSGVPAADARPRVERLAREGSVHDRALLLAMLSAPTDHDSYIEPLFGEALRADDARLRLAAVRGVSALSSGGSGPRPSACAAWRSALADADREVRAHARRALVGSVDFFIEEKNEIVAGRASPFAKACGADDVSAAIQAFEAEAPPASPEDRAWFYGSALRSGLPEAVGPATAALRAIAEDGKQKAEVRVVAVRALRRRTDNAELLAKLAGDPDPLVAKAAKEH